MDISGDLIGQDTSALRDRDLLYNKGRSTAEDIPSDESLSGDEAIISQHQINTNRKTSTAKDQISKKSGAFQTLGLSAALLKAISRKGFKVPTPIQRKTVPLLLEGKDVVGMARTGSGKTAAFVIPMLEKLKTHSVKIGSRALVLSPSRELALQSLQVVKDFARGTDLRCALFVGGDSLEEQFSAMTNNPDILIATPGRFLHLKVEMRLDLSSISYVVFDEADRLFEMGFAPQLSEILHALPASRQTSLFSATLPKSLVEFAKAGLQDPALVRLDADTKISANLQSAFFSVKSSEKEGALLHILQDVISVPTASRLARTEAAGNDSQSKKRKRVPMNASNDIVSELAQSATIIFAATKHHVEYLAQLLRQTGFSISYIYGALDQVARKQQLHAFRNGLSNILVVTDVAARGIDIPVLGNVINYDFPSQPKIFVHRVGRTARAEHRGWSYTLVQDSDCPYLVDLQLFLSRKLRVGRAADHKPNYSQEVVVGQLAQDRLQDSCEQANMLLSSDVDLASLRHVASRAEKQYLRSRNAASSQSAKRARDLVASSSWSEVHPLFIRESDMAVTDRELMLARVGNFRPPESIFEIGQRRGGRRGNEEGIEAIRKIRSGFQKKMDKLNSNNTNLHYEASIDKKRKDPGNPSGSESDNDIDMTDDLDAMYSETNVDVVFPEDQGGRANEYTGSDLDLANMFRSQENFMSYAPIHRDLNEDKAYGVHSGTQANFTQAARSATMDLANDENNKGFGEARGIMRWDKRHKKYVSRENDEDGSKGRKLVRGESGAKIAASFRSGRYDSWRKAHRVDAVRTGGREGQTGDVSQANGKKYRHQSLKAPKAADKYREDYDKKKKKQQTAAKERMESGGSNSKGELRSVDDIRKQRRLKQNRQAKNARPSKKAVRRR